MASYQDFVSFALGLDAALNETLRDRSWEAVVDCCVEEAGFVDPVVPVAVWVGYITE
jgi:hypothetical protein